MEGIDFAHGASRADMVAGEELTRPGPGEAGIHMCSIRGCALTGASRAFAYIDACVKPLTRVPTQGQYDHKSTLAPAAKGAGRMHRLQAIFEMQFSVSRTKACP